MRPGEPLDAERILAALNAAGVKYIVIGAMAAMFHGSPLRTEDIDICPEDGARNLARLAEALNSLGAREWDPRKEKANERTFDAVTLASDRAWLLVTEHGPLDIVFDPAGTGGYRDLAAHASTFEVDGLVVRVADLADIIRSKEATGRDHDRHQLPTLKRLLHRLEEETENQDVPGD